MHIQMRIVIGLAALDEWKNQIIPNQSGGPAECYFFKDLKSVWQMTETQFNYPRPMNGGGLLKKLENVCKQKKLALVVGSARDSTLPDWILFTFFGGNFSLTLPCFLLRFDVLLPFFVSFLYADFFWFMSFSCYGNSCSVFTLSLSFGWSLRLVGSWTHVNSSGTVGRRKYSLLVFLR